MDRCLGRPHRRPASALALGLLLSLWPGHAVTPATSEPPAPALDSARVSWRQLRYQATKLMITVTSQVELTPLDGPVTAAALQPSPQSTALVPGSEATWQLVVSSAFLGRQTRDLLWFSAHGTALQKRSERRGGKEYDKLLRFTVGGTYQRRTSPAGDAEAAKTAAAWTGVHETFFPYDAAAAGCTVVADPGALFYLVSAAELNPGDPPLTLCAFFGKVLNQLEIRALGRKELEVDFRETRGGRQNHRQGKVETLQLGVRARSLQPGQENAELEVLGLTGDVEVYLDLLRHLPVQVSGNLPHAGRVDVRLVEAELR